MPLLYVIEAFNKTVDDNGADKDRLELMNARTTKLTTTRSLGDYVRYLHGN